MSKLFYKAMIEDVQNEHCTGTEREVLLDVFEYTIQKMATTLARKAWYDLQDYATAKRYGIDRFTLLIEHKDVLGQEQWHGVFETGSKRLQIIATLSPEDHPRSEQAGLDPTVQKVA